MQPRAWLGVPLCRLHVMQYLFWLQWQCYTVHRSNSYVAAHYMADAAVLADSPLFFCNHLDESSVYVPVIAPSVLVAAVVADGPIPRPRLLTLG